MGNSSPDMSAVQLAAMNAAMRASMSSMVDQSQSLLQQQQNTSPTLRMQEAFLRSQAEALRLAVSQAVAASTTQQSDTNSLRQHSIATTIANTQNFNHQGQVSPDLTEALRLQEQRLEQALRLHGDPRALGFSLPNHQHPWGFSYFWEEQSGSEQGQTFSELNSPNASHTRKRQSAPTGYPADLKQRRMSPQFEEMKRAGLFLNENSSFQNQDTNQNYKIL